MKNKLYILFILVFSVFMIVGCTSNTPQSSGTTGNGAGNTATDVGSGSGNLADNGAGTGSTATGSGTGTTDTGSTATPGATDATVKTLNVEMYSWGIKVDGPQINKGDKVKLVVTDTSGTHGLAIPDFGVDVSPINPGETKTAEFTADKSGTFTYFCNVPCGEGHRAMRGTITVT